MQPAEMRSLSHRSVAMPRDLSLFLILCLLAVAACSQDDPAEEGLPAQTPAALVSPSPPPAVPAGRAEKAAAGQPAADATPTRSPAPTLDPQRDAWTVLVYLSAGGDLADVARQDLDEMEAAGGADGVNLVVQAGGLPAPGEDQVEGEPAGDEPAPVRRYEIEGDDGAAGLTAPAVAELDAVEMDDPGALADFVAWGVDRYPANRYALVLVERGGAGLAAPAVGGALAEAVQQTGTRRLDVVAFDAPLVGHVELFRAIQPHARYAAAAAGLFPEQGWDYTALLRALYREPDLSAADLASLMAAEALRAHPAGASPPPALAAAVDLQAMPAVSAALENLAATLDDDEALVLAAAALLDARRGAAFVAPAAPPEILSHPAVDLHRFAAILALRSPLRAPAAAARDLLDAVEVAAVPGESGDDSDGGRGLALAVPLAAGSAASADGASEERPFSGWPRLLLRASEAAAATSPPQLHVAYGGEGAAGVQQPAYLAAEVAGRHLADLALVAGLPGEDGRLRLVAHDSLAPEPAPLPGGALYRWRDGVHERGLVWETRAAYLTGGDDGDFVVLWPLAPGDERRAVWGRYRPAGAEAWVDGALIAGEETGELATVWTSGEEDGQRAPRRRALRRGDAFQPYDVYLVPGGALLFEPGVALSFDDGPLSLQQRPLPAGDARLGVVATTLDGARTGTFADLAVVNGDEATASVAYLHPGDGFQFLYPAGWTAPSPGDGVLRAGDAAGETRLTISRFPGLEGDVAAELKADTLELFGTVDVLYEEPIFIAGDGGLLTAYGYESDEGARTGLFVTFIHEGVGYVVDVDGPLEREPETIALVDRLVESWTFRPVGAEHFPGQWTRLDAGTFSVAAPQGVEHETLDNGWQRFSGDDAFISLRRDPSSGATRRGVLDRWLAVAARGVEQFMAADPGDAALAGRLWARADFEYQGRDGAVRGFVMAAIVGGEEIVAWAEAPAAAFGEVEESVFLLLMADAVSPIEGEGGLLYAATFDSLGTWGGGRLEGAEGTVAAGAYRLRVAAPEGFFWTTAGRSFGDGVYEVEATHAAGPADNGFGLIFRADPAGGTFYLFEIGSDGYVWIGRCDDGCARLTTLVGEGWFYSDAVRRGVGVANRLRVEATGPDLAFFVNGVEVGRAQDAALAEGDVGLFVETRGEGDVTVLFDNVQVTD